MPLRIIGLLSRSEEHSLLVGPVLSPEEEAEYIRSLNLLERFRNSRVIVPIIEGNLEAVSAVYTDLRRGMIEGDRNRARRVQLFQDLNRTFANFLSSLRMYRDHTLTRLAHMYERNTNIKDSFETRWSKALEENFAFAFVWRFRNYVQHFGMPFDKAAALVQDPERFVRDPDRPDGQLDIELGIKRDQLLRYTKWGHKLRRSLLQLPRTVPVQDYLEPAMRELGRIDAALVENESAALLPAGETLVRLASAGFEQGAYPGTMEVRDDNVPLGPTRFQLLPVEVLVHLDLAEARDTAAGPQTELTKAGRLAASR